MPGVGGGSGSKNHGRREKERQGGRERERPCLEWWQKFTKNWGLWSTHFSATWGPIKQINSCLAIESFTSEDAYHFSGCLYRVSDTCQG